MITQILIDEFIVFFGDVFESLKNNGNEKPQKDHTNHQIVREKVDYSIVLRSTANRFD
jgi:hypothetical protein